MEDRSRNERVLLGGNFAKSLFKGVLLTILKYTENTRYLVRTHKHKHTYTHAHTHTCTHAHMHPHTHIHTHAHTHTSTHTNTQKLASQRRNHSVSRWAGI